MKDWNWVLGVEKVLGPHCKRSGSWGWKVRLETAGMKCGQQLDKENGEDGAEE